MGSYPTFVVKFSNKNGTYTSGTDSMPLYDGEPDSIADLALRRLLRPVHRLVGVVGRIGIAAGPVPMRDVEVWVDGRKVAEQIDGFSCYTYMKRSVSLSSGTHQVTVFAAGWDQSLQKKSFVLRVH